MAQHGYETRPRVRLAITAKVGNVSVLLQEEDATPDVLDAIDHVTEARQSLNKCLSNAREAILASTPFAGSTYYRDKDRS